MFRCEHPLNGCFRYFSHIVQCSTASKTRSVLYVIHNRFDIQLVGMANSCSYSTLNVKGRKEV